VSTKLLGVEVVDGIEYRISGQLPNAALLSFVRRSDDPVWAYAPDDSTHIILTLNGRRVVIPRPFLRWPPPLTPGWRARVDADTKAVLKKAVARLGHCPKCGSLDGEPCRGARGKELGDYRHPDRQP
jgi:hypothetical protein